MKIVHDKTNARVILNDDSRAAFYTDKFNTEEYHCSDKVVDTVVEMFNDGKDLIDIDEYLLDEGECTQEAREVIVEGLFLILYPHLNGH
jgi:hypothetical protein